MAQHEIRKRRRTPDRLNHLIAATFPSIEQENSPVFQSVARVMSELEGAGRSAERNEIAKHLAYLSEKAGAPMDRILSGEDFDAPNDVYADTITNICSVLSSMRPTRQRLPESGAVENVIQAACDRLEGWCSPEKARSLAQLILAEKPTVCVEIGVYGGRSLFPCAAALRQNAHGVIFGIEAWSVETAVANSTSEEHDTWWQSLDFGPIKSQFFRFMVEQQLHEHVKLLEAPSAKVAHLFQRIDFLHIDGAHSVINAAEDVILFATRVPPGGIIVMDDIEWETTGPARDILMSFCDEIETISNPNTGVPSCAVLRVRGHRTQSRP